MCKIIDEMKKHRHLCGTGKRTCWQFKTRLALILSTVFLMTAPTAAQSPPPIQVIKNSLTCVCDCNMTVEACQGAMACESADKLTAEAQQLIDQGLDKNAVLASFISRYGEQILSAPTKKGFNLTAWVTPFLLILGAGFLIIQFVRKWSRQQEKQQQRKKSSGTGNDRRYEQMLDDVLKTLD